MRRRQVERAVLAALRSMGRPRNPRWMDLKSSNSNSQSLVAIAVQISDRAWLAASSVDRRRILRGLSSPGHRGLVVLVRRMGPRRVCSIGTGRLSSVR